jgi:outer membrane protein assembly factor BamB
MKTSDLLFIGIKGSVVALNRATGERVWATHLKGADFVSVVVHEGTVLASCCGEVFCLDSGTGNARWHDPLKGFGRGLASIAIEGCTGSGTAAALVAKRRAEEAAAGAAAAA